jgi:hypothetical protein
VKARHGASPVSPKDAVEDDDRCDQKEEFYDADYAVHTPN